MFTGIVTDKGRLREIARDGETRFVIETGWDPAGLAEGASVACSGVCLTVVDKGGAAGSGWFAVEVSAETLACTTLGDWRPGTAVNLERPLEMGDELGGHLVLGHVDGVASLVGRREEGGSLRLAFEAPAELARFIAPKGSVALDGVSLTVNEVADGPGGCRFGVNVIPHTAAATTLGSCREGGRVNLEIDLLARYVRRLMDAG